jgi:hypothetical protein
MSELDKKVKKFMESEPLNFTKEGRFYIDRTRKITDPAVERIVVPEGKVLAVSLTLPEEVAKNFYVAQQRAVAETKLELIRDVLKLCNRLPYRRSYSVRKALEPVRDRFKRELKELKEEE